MAGCCSSMGFNRQQWMTTITFVVVNFCNAMCVSMQAPFYPREAEKKGCAPSEYGLVFGIFELTVFIVSPIVGANLNKMGMKATLNIGIGTVGVTSILFGLLDKIENGKVFLGLSFALRIIEACGNSCFLTGSFSMIAKEFPENVAFMFALLETFFGMGMIFGPTVGGALYEWGGFTLPFASLGSVLVCATLLTYFILPSPTQETSTPENKPSMISALKVPSILMASYNVMCAAMSLGFLQATLEPHMREFDLSPLLLGSMFVVQGAFYGVSAPIWGFICDRKPPKVISLCGAVLITLAFTLIGPLPFFPFKKSVGLIIGSLVLHGLGLGAEVVSGFADAHKQALAAGFPDTIDTYGLISGLWTSVFAFGAFVGPTAAGILFDVVGFPLGTLFVIGSQLIVILLVSGIGLTARFRSRSSGSPIAEGGEDESTNLLDSGEAENNVPGTSYGANETQEERRDRVRHRRRRRKYSEAVSGSVAGSVARSLSMAHPQFMMPGVANSYRNPPSSMATGAVGGSIAADIDPGDSIVHVEE